MSEQFNDSRKTSSGGARVIFPAGTQRQILETVYRKLGRGSWLTIAQLCGVHRRTLTDWHREKYTISLAAVAALRNRWPELPTPTVIVSPFRHLARAGRRGALSRYRQYGNPGTEAGRRKGGRASQRLFRSDPERARRIGFLIRKIIRQPARSEQLAELVGVLLGDGHIARWQVMVYLNLTERTMALHVQHLIEQLFGIMPTLHRRRTHFVVVASSRNLVEWLIRCGVCAGDKIRRRAIVPAWVFRRPAFMRACLRGLIDTDGSFFTHRHHVRGYAYEHVGVAFTSYAPSLLRSVTRLMAELNFGARTYPTRGHVMIYRWDQVQRYMEQIGTRHPHRKQQFDHYQEVRRGRVVAERTRLESV